MAANQIAGKVITPGKTQVPVVYADVLVDGEQQADMVATHFCDAQICYDDGVQTLRARQSLSYDLGPETGPDAILDGYGQCVVGNALGRQA